MRQQKNILVSTNKHAFPPTTALSQPLAHFTGHHKITGLCET
jgi:hypothetical protein